METSVEGTDTDNTPPDVTFEIVENCGDGEPVITPVTFNKSILARGSPVFKAHFSNSMVNMEPWNNKIKGTTLKAFVTMVQFLYNPKTFKLDISDLSELDDLKNIAEKYEVASLVKKIDQVEVFDAPIEDEELDIKLGEEGEFADDEFSDHTNNASLLNTGSTGEGYVAVSCTGFKDLLLKEELLAAIADCGFEHPSTVQLECLPQAVLGMDVVCQAKSGMGKTAVFVLATLQQLDTSTNDTVSVIVLCHTRELAYQISKEYQRFGKYLPEVKVATFVGGLGGQDKERLKNSTPHIVVGTPGRIRDLVEGKDLKLRHVKHFILDDCDHMLNRLEMRWDVQEIFFATSTEKQTMMFSATLNDETRGVCKRFMVDPLEVIVEDDAKLTLRGLQQRYVKVTEREKNSQICRILDKVEFDQVLIFVNSIERCLRLTDLLKDQNFPAIDMHSGMSQEDRLSRYQQFKEFQKRIMVSTELFGRGIDIERVNLVVNYDMPENSDTYLHRVARAGRFGTRGMAVSFLEDRGETEMLNKVQDRFDITIKEF